MADIVGIIEGIIFRNDENGFSVIEIHDENEKKLVTAVGIFPFINIGERVLLKGEWTEHKDYGRQFKMDSFSCIGPSNLVGMENYLSSGMIKGVGPATAKKIVEHFGMDALDIIQFNPQRLTEIDGIGETRSMLIASSFEEQKEIREIMLFLQTYNISSNYALKIYKKYGAETINIIKENPYRLADEVTGIGFKRADVIAIGMGVPHDSSYRACAGIKYILSCSVSDGHTYLFRDDLIEKTAKLLQVDVTIIENAIVSLAISRSIYLEEIDGTAAVFLAPYYYAELASAKKLIELTISKPERVIYDIDDRIKKFETKHGITLAKQQREAVKEAMTAGVVVITGGPGTGKTTTINCIIELFTQEGLEVELAAPTGRAAKRMTEASGYEAKTIHRLLEYGFSDDDEEVFNKNESNPLKADAVIVDEVSMVDILLLNNFLRALLPGTRLILVGDIDQLPSVGPGNVLRDIINSSIISVVKLNEIFRQARESMIILNAHRVNNGEPPLFNVKNKDFFLVRKSTPEDILSAVSDLVSYRLPQYNGYDSLKDIQVIVPMRKGTVGVKNINNLLQKVLNPPSHLKKEKSYGETLFRVGDKVMQIKNNYNLRWTLVNDENVDGEGIFNGDIGRITDIDMDNHTVTVVFDDEKVVVYDFIQLDELELSYAVSVHKSQGSEFPVVVLPIFHGPPMLMTRNLLYTAITRAKELVVIVGQEDIVARMTGNNHIAKRNSNLLNRLKQIGGAVTAD